MSEVLVLDSERQELLKTVVDLLGLENVTDNNEIFIGGGTVLAAQWHHRVSTDIKLFTSASHFLKIRESILRKIRNSGLEYMTHSSVLRCRLHDGTEFLLGESRNTTEHPYDNKRESVLGLPVHSTPEILLRKNPSSNVECSNLLYS